MWLLALTGCYWWLPPTTTSTTGMAGRILLPNGKPLVGQMVETLETSELTDERGQFGIYYKKPDLQVTWTHAETTYRRAYREVDEGQLLDIMLPPLHDLQVTCGPFECRVELDWELADGLRSQRRFACSPEATVILRGVPQGIPALTCQASITEPELEVDPVYTHDRVVFRVPPRPIVLQVAGDTPGEPCQVPGQPEGLSLDGTLTVNAQDGQWFHAVCEGRPGIPVKVGPETTALSLPWSKQGPMLVPPPGVELSRLLLTGPGWTLQTEAGDEGGFLLPPLPAGVYTVQLHNTEPSSIPVETATPSRPGLVEGQMLATGQMVGRLLIERELEVIDVELR